MMNRARDNGVSVSPGAERDPRNSLGEGRVRVMRYLHAGGLGGGGCSVARWTACMTSRTFLKKVLLKQFMEIQTTFIIGSIWDHSIFHVREMGPHHDLVAAPPPPPLSYRSRSTTATPGRLPTPPRADASLGAAPSDCTREGRTPDAPSMHGTVSVDVAPVVCAV